MPVAAIIKGKIFCVYGGLSPLIYTVDQIKLIKTKTRNTSWRCILRFNVEWYWGLDYVCMRCRICFWVEVVNEFNRINRWELIFRANQLVNEGFKYWFRDKNLVTVWSAPNYCYRCGNKASILKWGPKF